MTEMLKDNKKESRRYNTDGYDEVYERMDLAVPLRLGEL